MRRRLVIVAAAVASFHACGPDLSPPIFPDSVAEPGLEEKLERQWLHFEHARAVLVARGSRSRLLPFPRLSRTRWERLLTPEAAYRFTATELNELRALQESRMGLSRRIACERSSLDMDRVRASDQVGAFARSLPKGGLLHVHPTGTLARGTVDRLLRESNPRIRVAEWREALERDGAIFHEDELSFLDPDREVVRYAELGPEDQRRLAELFHLPPGRHSFERFAAIFRLLPLVQAGSDHVAYSLIYEDLFRRAREHGVIYLELTQGFSPEPKSIAEWDHRVAMAEDRFGLVVRVNLAFDRTRRPARNRSRLHRLIGAGSSNIVGIDLVGQEVGHPALEQGEPIYATWLAARERGETNLRATIHAAGLGEARNVRDALIFGVDRVGHGVGLVADPVVLEYGSRRALPVEANLTSNVRLGYAESFESHPFLDLLRLGYRVSLSTDDEGILDTDISREFARAIRNTDICFEEIRQLVFNSIGSAFLDPDTRDGLRIRLEEDFQRFEAVWMPVAGMSTPD